MEREACRAAMLPMVMRFGQPFCSGLLLISWKLPERSCGFARILSASRPARSPGDVYGILIDSEDSVVHVFGPFPAIARRQRRDPEADTGEGLNGHSPPVQPFPNLRAHVFSDISQNPTTAMFARCETAAAPTTIGYSHNTAILGAINSIYWLHDCHHSSLAVATATAPG